MASPAYIGRLRQDGKILAVYCHYGSILDIGEELLKYPTDKIASELTMYGLYSIKDSNLDRLSVMAGHNFVPMSFADLDQFELFLGDEFTEALYLFDGTVWKYYSNETYILHLEGKLESPWMRLRTAMMTDNV